VDLESKLTQSQREVERLSGITGVVGGQELTVSQLEKRIAEVKQKEILAGAEKLFERYKAEWRVKTKPAEVREEALKTLSVIIKVLGSPGPKYFTREINQLGLPEDIEKMISADVQRRLMRSFKEELRENRTRDLQRS